MNIEQGVRAYLDAITIKYQIENNARIIYRDQVLGIQFPQWLIQPWPREFNYRYEFYTGNNSPAYVINEINNCFENSPEEHILQVFSDQLNQLIPAYRHLGYSHAWSNIMMVRKLSINEKKDSFRGVEIKPIKTFQDVALVNSIEPDIPCSTNGLDNTDIHNLMASYNGQVCAKAQLITHEGNYAYIADLFTHPNFRRKGISTALLQEMHNIAINSGNTQSVLIPSKMTREFDLFQKFSYQALVEMALMVPEQLQTSLKKQL